MLSPLRCCFLLARLQSNPAWGLPTLEQVWRSGLAHRRECYTVKRTDSIPSSIQPPTHPPSYSFIVQTIKRLPCSRHLTPNHGSWADKAQLLPLLEWAGEAHEAPLRSTDTKELLPGNHIVQEGPRSSPMFSYGPALCS